MFGLSKVGLEGYGGPNLALSGSATIHEAALKPAHTPEEIANKNKNSEYNRQLDMGIDIEKEHTTDPIIAKNIARDHLAEIKNYYSRLKKINISLVLIAMLTKN
jgi:hypothetical protein